MTKLNILYASMWGNAEAVANDLNQLAKDEGIDTNISEMNDVTMEQFENMQKVAVVTSTTGQGDVPTNGAEFFDNLEQASLKLQNMKYGVCALGDSSHADFCGAGKKVDKRLSELGATSVIQRQECDGDTEGSAEWSQKFIQEIK